MKCTSCNWIGSRGELVADKRFGQTSLDEHFFKLTNWNCCPRCNRKLEVKDSHNEISLAFNNTVFCIDSPLHNKPTHIHLGRILDFSVSPFGISFLGYKIPTHLAQTFKLTVLLNGFEDHKFESLSTETPRSNNKFSMLFGSKEIEEEQTICCCNEISNTSDCTFHKSTV